MQLDDVGLRIASLVNIGPNILWLFFGVLVFVFLIVSAVLLFHWRRYGMKNKRIVVSELIYLVGGGVIIFFSVITLLRI